MTKTKFKQSAIFAVVFVLVLGLIFGLLSMTDRKQASAAEIPQTETVTPLSSTLGIDDNMTVTDDITIVAKYEDATYTVTFKMLNADGSDNTVTRTATHGHKLSEYIPASGDITAPTGKHLIGWNHLGTEIITGGIIVTATYDWNTYTITFAMLNTNGSANNVTVTATHGHKLSEYIPTTTTAPTGKHLTGWNQPGTATITGAMTVTATYDWNTYTITFSYLNAAGQTQTKTATATHGHKLSEYIPTSGITAPTGKNHTGWDKVGTTVVTGAMTINATYAWNTYTLTFSMFKADGSTNNVTVTATHGHELSEYIPATTTAPTGKHLTGWNKTGTTTITDAMTITAQYAWNTYTITFAMLNTDGSVNNATVTATHGHNLSEYIPTSGITSPTGKHLTGWDKVGTTTIIGGMTVTAQYAWDQFTVTFRYLNAEGEITEETKTVDYGTKIVDILPEIPEVPGKVFTGWGINEKMFVTQNLRVVMETGVTDIDGNPVIPPEEEESKNLFDMINGLGSPWKEFIYTAGVLVILGILLVIVKAIVPRGRRR